MESFQRVETGATGIDAYEEVTELPATKQAAFDSSHVYHVHRKEGCRSPQRSPVSKR